MKQSGKFTVCRKDYKPKGAKPCHSWTDRISSFSPGTRIWLPVLLEPNTKRGTRCGCAVTASISSRVQLSAKKFHTFLPEVPTWSPRLGMTHTVRAPMFPGYLFVRDAMSKTRYIDLLKVRGIVRVLEAGWSRLTPVPDEDIETIQRIVQAAVPVFPHAHLRQGDRVRVLEGPLTGLEGIFVQDRPSRGRLVVSMNMLGRSVAVEVDGADVGRAHPRRHGRDGRVQHDERKLAVIMVVALLAAHGASAQTTTSLMPALSVTTVYDDNVFSQPQGTADLITALQPSLEAQLRSPTVNLQGLMSFDMQRSARNTMPTTLDARRHAMFDGRVRSTPSILLGLTGLYDRTETASDLNLELRACCFPGSAHSASRPRRPPLIA